MRIGLGVAAAVLMILIALSGIDRVREGEALVVSPRFGGSPTVLAQGTHWNAPFIGKKGRYPVGPTSLALSVEPGAITSSEGEPVGLELVAEIEIRTDRLTALHTEVGPDFRNRLAREIVRRTEETLDGLPLREIYLVRWLQIGNEILDALTQEPLGNLSGLRSVSVERAYIAPETERALLMEEAAASSQKVMILGIDGADWNIIRPMFQRGELPHLRRLVDEGVSAELESIRPLLSPLIWTSIVTGKLPDKHGILDFFAEDPATGKQVPVTSNLRRTKALWNIGSETGMEVCFVDWLASWPAERVEGVIVSDRLAYHSFDPTPHHYQAERKTYPEELLGTLDPLIKKDRDVSYEEARRFLGIDRAEFQAHAGGSYDPADLIQNFRLIYATTETYRNIGLKLATRPYRMFGVYFELLDAASHLFIKHMDPVMEDIPPEETLKFRGAVEEVYRYQDEILGEFMETCDKQTTVIALSDHGFRSGPLRLKSRSQIHGPGGAAAEWHRLHGVFVIWGPHIRRGVKLDRASVLDVTPTVLYLTGLPVAADMDGKVLTEAIAPDYLAEHPVLTLPTYESGESAEDQAPIPSADDKVLRERLAALGYVSKEGANVHNNLAQSYLERGEFEKALVEYRLALEMEPRAARLWNNYGMAFLRMESYEEAVEPLQRALELKPDYEPALTNLAVAYTYTGKLDEAAGVMEKVVELEPGRAEYHDNLGVVYMRLGRTERALACFRAAAALEPKFPEPYNNLGVVAMQIGKNDEARTSFKQAIRQSPNFYDAHFNLGLLDLKLDNPEAAAVSLKAAVEINPRRPDVHYQLGEAYWKMGREGDARAEWRATAALDPDGTYGRQAADRLED